MQWKYGDMRFDCMETHWISNSTHSKCNAEIYQRSTAKCVFTIPYWPFCIQLNCESQSQNVIRPTGSTELNELHGIIPFYQMANAPHTRRLRLEKYWYFSSFFSRCHRTRLPLPAEAPQDFLPTFNIQLNVVYWYNSLLIFDMPFNCYFCSDNRNCWNGWRAWLYHCARLNIDWTSERSMSNICRRVKIQQATACVCAVYGTSSKAFVDPRTHWRHNVARWSGARCVIRMLPHIRNHLLITFNQNTSKLDLPRNDYVYQLLA